MAPLFDAATALAGQACRVLGSRAALHGIRPGVAEMLAAAAEPLAVARAALGSAGAASGRMLMGVVGDRLTPDAALELSRLIGDAACRAVMLRHAPIAGSLRPLFADLRDRLTVAAFGTGLRSGIAVFAAACRLADEGVFAPECPAVLVLALGQGDFMLAAALLAASSGAPMGDVARDLAAGGAAARGAALAAGLGQAHADLAALASAVRRQAGLPRTCAEREGFRSLLAGEAAASAAISGDAAYDEIAFMLAPQPAAGSCWEAESSLAYGGW